jgi:hypothetical protein
MKMGLCERPESAQYGAMIQGFIVRVGSNEQGGG